MNEAELKTAIIILQGCIKVRQDKRIAIEHNGIAIDEVPRLKAEIDDLKLAIEYIKGLL